MTNPLAALRGRLSGQPRTIPRESDEDVARWNRLARYNGEVSRGIVHTESYDLWMQAEKRAFDEAMRRRAEERGDVML